MCLSTQHTGRHQTLALWAAAHGSILLKVHTCGVLACTSECAQTSFPFAAAFVWVSVSGVVCWQAPIVLNHCSLLTQGPWRSVFPWPPSRGGRKAETESSDLGRVCLHSPFPPLVLLEFWSSGTGQKRMAALCKLCV